MPNPDLIPEPFAQSGDKNTIPLERAIADPIYRASWKAGFPPDTRLPKDLGGEAPDGLDFNGVLNILSQAVVFLQKGNAYQFDASMAPYPIGALVRSNDNLTTYQSTVPNNSNNPNSNMTGWRVYNGSGFIVDNLTTNDSTKALSAAQGKVLGDRTKQATSTNKGIMSLINSLDSNDELSALSAAMGKQLSDHLDMLLYSPIAWFSTIAPSGYIVMDGRTITQAQYPKLYARYGSKLPDLRGSFIRGYGGNSDAIGVTQGDAIRNITGTYQSYSNSQLNAKTGAFYDAGQTGGGSGGDRYNRALGFDASRVVPTANENRPINVAFLYIVKAG